MLTRTRCFKLVSVFVLVAVLLPGVLTAAAPAAPNAGWMEVGAGSASGKGISNDSGGSFSPMIAISPGGQVYVAWWNSGGGDDEIYVRRWNGSTWEEVGANSASGGGISNNSGNSRHPSIAVAPNGTPYVAWDDDSGGDTEIYVRRWNGSSWEEVGLGSATGGGISNNSGGSEGPSIAIAPNGTPYVAWDDDSSGSSEIYVRRWNGSNWEEVGAGSATGGGISNVYRSWHSAIAIAPNGTPYVAWEGYDGTLGGIYVRRWNGSDWEEVGVGSASGRGISNSIRSSEEAAIAITPDGTPYVVWYNEHPVESGNFEIYVRRWSGSAWEEVGADSATGGGISDNDGPSGFPSIAVASDGTPYVAWLNGETMNDADIYVRRWNGSSWVEAGAGSASGGGISDTDDAWYPSVAIAPDGIPYVAWYDWNNSDVYVRRWMPPAFQIAPASLMFLAESGGTDLLPGQVVVNGVRGIITWTATISPRADWLNVTPLSGTTPATITATVSISGLAVGHYTTTIRIEGEGELLNSPQDVAVGLAVADEIYSTFLPLVLRGH